MFDAFVILPRVETIDEHRDDPRMLWSSITLPIMLVSLDEVTNDDYDALLPRSEIQHLGIMMILHEMLVVDLMTRMKLKMEMVWKMVAVHMQVNLAVSHQIVQDQVVEVA
jgi:hypothetical protein